MIIVHNQNEKRAILSKETYIQKELPSVIEGVLFVPLILEMFEPFEKFTNKIKEHFFGW